MLSIIRKHNCSQAAADDRLSGTKPAISISSNNFSRARKDMAKQVCADRLMFLGKGPPWEACHRRAPVVHCPPQLIEISWVICCQYFIITGGNAPLGRLLRAPGGDYSECPITCGGEHLVQYGKLPLLCLWYGKGVYFLDPLTQ